MNTTATSCLDIDYEVLARASRFYKKKGYQYHNVPWVVGLQALQATAPLGAEKFAVQGGFLVASGEQSFLQLCADGQAPDGPAFCITPCFRSEEVYDAVTLPHFLKLELFHKVDGHTAAFRSAKRMINHAWEFLKKIGANARVVETASGEDLVAAEGGVELGSYGCRQHSELGWWAYGTGLALPRASRCIQQDG